MLLVRILMIGILPIPLLQVQDAIPNTPALLEEAHRSGELYEVIIREAWSGDSNAVTALFASEDLQSFHDQARLELRQVLWSLLQHLGDQRFAEVLAARDLRIRTAIIRALKSVSSRDTLRARYPLTWRLGTRPVGR